MSVVSKALKKAGGQAQNTFNDTVDGAQDAADHAANEAKKIGKQLLNGLEDIGAELQQIFDPSIIGIRGLRFNERDIMQRVYQDSLPRMNNILIISLLGASGRPFALPASFVAGVATLILPGSGLLLASLVLLAAKRGDCYFLFLGNRGYNDAVGGFPKDKRPGQTLVHEACHVWQGWQGAFTWEYIFNSIYNQCLKGGAAYDIPDQPSAQWDHFGAEQQAGIVEGWVANGRHTTGDPYYPYIKSNVRPGLPHATTEF
jgi:hypothetical protein